MPWILAIWLSKPAAKLKELQAQMTESPSPAGSRVMVEALEKFLRAYSPKTSPAMKAERCRQVFVMTFAKQEKVLVQSAGARA